MPVSDISTGLDLSSYSAYQAQQANSKFTLDRVAPLNEKPATAFKTSDYGADTRTGVNNTLPTTSRIPARSSSSDGSPRGQYVDIFA